ncbi:MAG TPA: hypothetical protein VHL34_25125 [Rhizomicrobium sp.]|jgi:hypothetical protein|nr:hypothetical protein [Rhizomicrobium sp.]
MTRLTPALDAAFAAQTHTPFGALRIALPSYTLRLLLGGGTAIFGGETYVSNDPTFGALQSIDDLSDGTGDTAPSLSFTLLTASDAAAAAIASAQMQGSEVKLFIGAVDPETGQVIGTDLRFIGELDVPKLIAGKGSRVIQYDCISAWDDFFFDDDGARLNDTFHQYIFPGERGLSFVSAVADQIYWGQENPSGVKR